CQERDACSSRDVRVMESTFPACQEERYRVERLAAPPVHIGKSPFAAILVRVLVAEIVFLANVGAVPAARFHSVSARGGKGERSAGYQHDNRGHQNLLHFSSLQISDIDGIFLPSCGQSPRGCRSALAHPIYTLESKTTLRHGYLLLGFFITGAGFEW